MTANRIIDHIFQQPDLPRVDQAALAKLVGDYPYFTAGRLLLAQKDYSMHQSMHSPAIKKAMLYSNNPHYVYQFITGELEKDIPSATTQVPVEEIVVTTEEATITEEVEMIAEAETPAMVATEEEIITEEEEMIAEAETPAMVTTEEEIITEEEEMIAEAETPAMVATEGEIITEEEEMIAEATVPAEAAVAPLEIPVAAPALTVEQPEVVAATDTTTAPAAEIIDNEALKPAYPEDTPDQDDPIKIFPLDIPAEETTLTFQPLYTDDYFAYKRLKEPARADDLNEKGMAEMKSFTDWLRQMKDSFAGKAQKDWYHQHLHHIYEDEEPEVSEAVEQMAMKSITLNDDIVSETLAEIWARQHQYQAAIHIYQKLSLLNPDKSAYFAQKIKELQLAKEKINSNKH